MTKAEKGRTSFHLLDAAALIVGYGLASMLIRAYWPKSEPPGLPVALVISIVFLWLGLAMSGPIVLLIRRPPAQPSGDADAEATSPGLRTWAELAWMIIGFYWIGLTILVVPVRSNGARFLDSAVLGLFPVLASLGLWLFSPAKNRPTGGLASWTHRAGVALLMTWPLAWMALIVLGKTF